MKIEQKYAKIGERGQIVIPKKNEGRGGYASQSTCENN